jgi:4-hydroxymandelate oxidase
VERWGDLVEARAREILPEAVHRYLRQGARTGVSAAEATTAWDRFRFQPGVLRDVTDVEVGTTLLGSPVRSPVGVAPTTMQRAVHTDGEVATARAAAEAGAVMVLSSNAGSTFEEVAATGVTWWLQLYVPADRQLCRPVLDRAVAAGAAAVVLTVDTAVVGTKYDGGAETVWDLAEPGWLRANFPAQAPDLPGTGKATDLGPADIEWLRRTTGLPVVVKGVLRPADARRSVGAGAAAVWVSNHGGRQLDRAVATADALGGVVDAVAGSAEVYVDGGVRDAGHVVAALALGARGVFLGRPPLYALAVEGQRSVARLLQGLAEDLEDTLRLAGYASVAAVDRELLARRDGGHRNLI